MSLMQAMMLLLNLLVAVAAAAPRRPMSLTQAMMVAVAAAALRRPTSLTQATMPLLNLLVAVAAAVLCRPVPVKTIPVNPASAIAQRVNSVSFHRAKPCCQAVSLSLMMRGHQTTHAKHAMNLVTRETIFAGQEKDTTSFAINATRMEH
jgi:hypothetical protein